MVTLKQQLVASTKNISTNANARKTVTIHETGNEGATAGAQSHANLQSRPNPRVASWHYQVDALCAIQSFPNHIRTFHAGTARGNREGISVEICVNSRAGFRQAVQNAAELTASILREEGLGISAVVQHNGYSGKNCPTHLRRGDWGVTWGDFINMVKAALNGSTPAPAPSTPAPAPAPTPSTGYKALLVDGAWGAQTSLALQRQLRTDGFYSGTLDGNFGPVSKKALQRWLKQFGGYTGLIDGVLGPISMKSFQTLLKNLGFYSGRIDGDFGRVSTKALQTFLNSRRSTWK